MKKLTFDDIKGRVSEKYPNFTVEIEDQEVTLANPFRQDKEWREEFLKRSRTAFPGKPAEGEEAPERTEGEVAEAIRNILRYACTTGNFDIVEQAVGNDDDLTMWYEIYDAYTDGVAAGER